MAAVDPSDASTQRPAWLADHLYPFASRFLAVTGCRVHYVDEGSGPVLLLLHGNPTWSFLYRDIIRGLSDRFRCVALDYPGFGLSTARPGYGFSPAEHAAVVAQFVLTLDLDAVTLLVHDWGGPIGLGMAARHPQRLRALIIGNTFAWPLNGIPRFELFSRLAGSPVGSIALRRHNAFVTLGLPLGARRTLPPAVLAAYRGPFPTPAARRPIQIFARALLGARDYLAGVEQGLTRLQHLPMLIAWGNRDPAFQASERHHFERHFLHHRTVILHGAGHFIQ